MIIILVQLCKMTVSPGAFWIFLKFSFFHFMYLRNCTYDSGFWYRCVKWWYLQQFFFFFFFHFFKILIFLIYTCLPKTTVMWGTVPEIQSQTNLFCHYGLSFDLYPIPPSWKPRAPKSWKNEKCIWTSGDAIILNLCNKKNDKIMYDYSIMECNRHTFLSL